MSPAHYQWSACTALRRALGYLSPTRYPAGHPRCSLSKLHRRFHGAVARRPGHARFAPRPGLETPGGKLRAGGSRGQTRRGHAARSGRESRA
eukprot:gene5011-biopygen8580